MFGKPFAAPTNNPSNTTHDKSLTKLSYGLSGYLILFFTVIMVISDWPIESGVNGWASISCLLQVTGVTLYIRFSSVCVCIVPFCHVSVAVLCFMSNYLCGVRWEKTKLVLSSSSLHAMLFRIRMVSQGLLSHLKCYLAVHKYIQINHSAITWVIKLKRTSI